MADQPLLTDDAALAHAEQMANSMKAFRHIEELVRYVRSTRAAVPALKDEYEALRAKVAAARLELQGVVASANAEHARLTAKTAAAEVAFQTADAARITASQERDQLLALTARLKADAHALAEDLHARVTQKSALEEERGALERAVAALQAQRDSFKKAAAAV